MKKAVYIVSALVFVAFIVLCFFTKCSLDTVALVIGAIVLGLGSFFNITTIKKLNKAEEN